MVKKFIFAIIMVLLIAGYVYSADTAIQVDMLVPGIELDGDPISGGKVYTYVSGTTTAKATYLDRNKVATATNPIILDSEGRAEIYADGLYKFVVKDSDDVTILTMDGVSYGVSDTPQWVYLSSYDSLSDAVTAIGVTPTVLVIDTTDTLTANVTVPSTITLMPVARNAIDVNSKTLTLNSGIWGGPFQWIIGTGIVTGTPVVGDYNHVWTKSTLTDSTTPSYTLQKEYNVYIHATNGDYPTLVAYLAGTPLAGDRVFWDVSETIGANETLAIPENVMVQQGFERILYVTGAWTGSDIMTLAESSKIIGRLTLVVADTSGTIGSAIRYTGNSADVEDMKVGGTTTATFTSGVLIDAGTSNNTGVIDINGSVTVSTVLTDNSTSGNNYVVALFTNAVYRSDGANTFDTPVIADFTSATHDHADNAGGGLINGVAEVIGDEVIRTAIYNVGDWDMTASATATVNHDLTLANIRKISVMIRDDGGSFFYPLDNYDNTINTAGGGVSNIDANNTDLRRADLGFFNGVNFDSTSYNRGWVIFEYVD
jgi:hypothetical protein